VSEWDPIKVKTLPHERLEPVRKRISLRTRVKGLNSILAAAFRQHEKDMEEANLLYVEALGDLKLVKELATKMRDGTITEEERATLEILLAERSEP
jgi:hypothetical protein